MSKQFQKSVKENPQIDKVWVNEKMEFYTFEMPNCKEVSREELLAADFEDEGAVETASATNDDSLEMAGKIIELQDALDEKALVIAELEKANEEFAKANEQLAAENAKLKAKK